MTRTEKGIERDRDNIQTSMRRKSCVDLRHYNICHLIPHWVAWVPKRSGIHILSEESREVGISSTPRKDQTCQEARITLSFKWNGTVRFG